jgi:hypothetical protein
VCGGGSLFTRVVIGFFLLAAFAFDQSATEAPSAEATHYPNVIHGELPLYPPIARAAHITGTVEIQLVVEKGAVIDAQVQSVGFDPSNRTVLSDEGKKKLGLYLSNPSLANVKTWQFESENRTTFLVTYVYKIEREETQLAESPKIELDMPRLVKVTTRPLKPTCSDCGADISGKPVGR